VTGVPLLLTLGLIACDPRPLPVRVEGTGPGVGGAMGAGGADAGPDAGRGDAMARVDCTMVDDICSCVARQGAEPLAGVAPECAGGADPFIASVNTCLDCRVTPSPYSMVVVIGNRGGQPTTGMSLAVGFLPPGTSPFKQIVLPDPIAAGALSVVSLPLDEYGSLYIQLTPDEPRADCAPANDTAQIRSDRFLCN